MKTHPIPSAVVREKLTLTIAFILFFLSGFAALLYQVAWHRMLAVFSGVDVYSLTITVAAFMAGLGFGNLLGGHIADRVDAKQRILLFGVSEVSIALFALVSKWLFYDFLYVQHSHLAQSPALLATVLFVTLLWPTFFMGVSLPLLSKGLTRRIEKAAGVVGALYGLNTLGAGVGAFLTGWVLVRSFGFEATIQCGILMNLVCGLGAFAIVRYLVVGKEAGYSTPDVEPGGSRTFSLAAWSLIYALSGFIALSLEILWFRVLEVMIKATAFTFPNLLAVYLLGVGGGAALGAPLARRSRNPAQLFFLLQAGIPVYAGLSIAALVYCLDKAPQLNGVWQYLGKQGFMNFAPSLFLIMQNIFDLGQVSQEMRSLAADLGILYFVLPLILIAPSTVMMGLSFALLQKTVQTDSKFVGRRVGWLQSANILGCILGVVLTSWFLLEFLGTAGSIKLLVGLSSLFLFFGISHRAADAKKRWALSSLAAAAILIVMWLTPNTSLLWSKLHGMKTGTIIEVEDGSGLCAIKIESSGRVLLYVNGVLHSWFPYGGSHTTFAIVPIMLHPSPKSVAVIGLGSGETAFSMGGREETEEIVCFEIVSSEIPALKRLGQSWSYEGLNVLFGDRRIKHLVADGRASIMNHAAKYDVIEADALFPFSAFSGNLYSVEFFALVKKRLKPGGLAVTWAPTTRVLQTFVKIFPHVLFISEASLLMGSEDPISFDGALMAERLLSPFSRAYYEKAGIDVDLFADFFVRCRPHLITNDYDRSRLKDINTDLYPRDEYLVSPKQ